MPANEREENGRSAVTKSGIHKKREEKREIEISSGERKGPRGYKRRKKREGR